MSSTQASLILNLAERTALSIFLPSRASISASTHSSIFSSKVMSS